MNKNVALVTGASQGIGKEIASVLAAAGIHVVIIARNLQNLETVKAEIEHNKGLCTAFCCDITKYEDVTMLFKQLAELHLLPNIIVNNAGFGGPFVCLEDLSVDDWDRVFDTNLKSIFYILRQAIPFLKQNNRGKIINIASAYGIMGGEKSVAYSASKHALVGLTKSLALELADYNIECNAILPGFIQTSMSEQPEHQELAKKIPTRKMGSPSDISELVLFLATTNSSYIHGSSIVVDGGLTSGMRIE